MAKKEKGAKYTAQLDLQEFNEAFPNIIKYFQVNGFKPDTNGFYTKEDLSIEVHSVKVIEVDDFLKTEEEKIINYIGIVRFKPSDKQYPNLGEQCLRFNPADINHFIFCLTAIRSFIKVDFKFSKSLESSESKINATAKLSSDFEIYNYFKETIK